MLIIAILLVFTGATGWLLYEVVHPVVGIVFGAFQAISAIIVFISFVLNRNETN